MLTAYNLSAVSIMQWSTETISEVIRIWILSLKILHIMTESSSRSWSTVIRNIRSAAHFLLYHCMKSCFCTPLKTLTDVQSGSKLLRYWAVVQMIDCSTFTDVAMTQYWLRVWKTHCWINVVELDRTACNALVVIINCRLCADRSVEEELTKQHSTFLRMIKLFKKLLISVISSYKRVWHWAVLLSVLEEKILKLSYHYC